MRAAGLAQMGPLCQRAPMGHGARGLQRRRRRLGLSSRTSTRAAAPIAGARTASAGSATTSSTSASAVALWNGKDPILKERLFGLTNRAGQSRRGRQGALLLSRCDADLQLRAHALQVSAGGISLRRVWSRRTRGATGSSPSSRSSIPASSTTTAISTSISNTPRRTPTTSCCGSRSTNRGPDDGGDSCAAAGLVSQHLELVHGRPQAVARARRRRTSWSSTRRSAPIRSTSSAPDEILFCDNETNAPKLFGAQETARLFQGRLPRISWCAATRTRSTPAQRAPRRPASTGATVAAGGSAVIRVRLSPGPPKPEPFADFDEIFRAAQSRGGRLLRRAAEQGRRTRTCAAFSARRSPACSGRSSIYLLRRHRVAGRRSGGAAAAREPPRRAQQRVGPCQHAKTSSRCRTSGNIPGSPPGTGPSIWSTLALSRSRSSPRSQLILLVPGLVHAPERPAAGLRMELQRRQSARAGLGGVAPLRDGAARRAARATASFSSASSPSCCSISPGG